MASLACQVASTFAYLASGHVLARHATALPVPRVVVPELLVGRRCLALVIAACLVVLRSRTLAVCADLPYHTACSSV